MSAHLVGVSALGGVPLFSRQVGQNCDQQVPFATLAALNGVNLFSRLNDANLETTGTKNAKIRWKVYHNNIVLILVATTAIDGHGRVERITDRCVQHMLDMIFESLVLTSGIDDLCDQNIERLKRSLKAAYPLVDYLLEQLITPEAHMTILTQSVPYTYLDASVVGDFIPTLIESYAHLCQSDFACVLVNGKMLAATKSWWQRISHTRDAAMVTAMVNCITPSLETAMNCVKEFSIYLPENCPNSVSRLVVAKINPGIVLVVLCGESPSLEVITTEALHPMKESDLHQDNFQKIQMLRNGSTLTALNDQILAIVMVKGECRSMLRYGNFDETKMRDMLTMINIGADAPRDEYMSLTKPNESYVKFRQYQGYRIADLDGNQLYILFPFVVSLSLMREISVQTFALFRDKKLWPRVH